MTIRFCKGDGTPYKRDTLVCVRDDGTSIWAQVGPGLAYHDLTHYTIEMVLDCRSAFFGLIAQGWTIGQFTDVDPATGRRPPLPDEAMQIETLVVIFQNASWDGTTNEQILETLAAGCAANGVPPLPLTSEQLDTLRERLLENWRAWDQTPPGKALELPFPAHR